MSPFPSLTDWLTQRLTEVGLKKFHALSARKLTQRPAQLKSFIRACNFFGTLSVPGDFPLKSPPSANSSLCLQLFELVCFVQGFMKILPDLKF